MTDLIERAHAVGLRVHPFTFRNEDEYLAWDYMQDPALEYMKFLQLGVDGYHTDFSHTLSRVLDVAYGEPCDTSAAQRYSAHVYYLLTTIILSFMM